MSSRRSRRGDRDRDDLEPVVEALAEGPLIDRRAQLLVGRGAYYLDPRLVSTGFSGSFGIFQEQNRFDDKESSMSGTLLGYTFDTVILSEKPYSVTTFASRTENVFSREFGGRSEITFENREGFNLRYEFIPEGRSSLRVARELRALLQVPQPVDAAFRLGAVPSRQARYEVREHRGLAEQGRADRVRPGSLRARPGQVLPHVSRQGA